MKPAPGKHQHRRRNATQPVTGELTVTAPEGLATVKIGNVTLTVAELQAR